MAQTTFYAWVVPGFFAGSPVDHTWVTTYDNRLHAYPNAAKVAEVGESYWFCWGDFHPKGGIPGNSTGFLGRGRGDRRLAECLVRPNADSQLVAAARGTIFIYGFDGVCHQLANQVLYATAPSGAPMTVKEARGYWASVFIYGPYGLQHGAWQNKLAVCRSLKMKGGAVMTGLPDEFEARARRVLKNKDRKLLADLLELRAQTQRFAAQPWPGAAPPSAEVLNARNQHLLDQAAAILGAKRFKQIFGFPPKKKIGLVDPRIK